MSSQYKPSPTNSRWYSEAPTEDKIRKAVKLIKDYGWKVQIALSMYGLEKKDIEGRL